MISVRQARLFIQEHTGLLPPVFIPLPEALGRVLAREVKSPSNYPLYDVSAMDGYALRRPDIRKASAIRPVFLKIRGTQQAGDAGQGSIGPGECRKVMTGAVIPPGADTVLEKEVVSEKDGFAKISETAARGRNIRYRGEGIKKGKTALRAGSLLHSRAIGFLASLGVERTWVRPAPRVALIVTGNELAAPGKKLKPGQIYNSNLWMLESALNESGIQPYRAIVAPDRPARIRRNIQKVFSGSDLLLLVGGVSVGDSDFSRPILESLGVRRIFWRVRQKPGFPLYFGKKGKTLVFGLPGNPASVWVNFHEYVIPCLEMMQGIASVNPPKSAKLASNGPNRGSKTLFLKAELKTKENNLEVVLLKGQGSHLLQSLAVGNCLAVAPPGKGRLKKGEMIEVHPLLGGAP